MSRQYYYLVAGLPDIFFDDKKLSVSVGEFRSFLDEQLSEKEMELIKTHFWQYDNNNILSLLENRAFEINPLGNLNSEMLDELLAASKDGAYESLTFFVPPYILQFIEAFRSDEVIFAGKAWDLQLSELYYQYLATINNTFIHDWYNFEKTLKNVFTAYNCKQNNINLENQLIGSDEVTNKLLKSSARDFGIDSDDLKQSEAFFKALEIVDLLEQEKKIDLLKWELLDEASFFHYFSIEKLFVFLIKLSIAERWIGLDKETGLELFKELLNSLETSYEFPGEFSLK
jgi:hypothetical protein